MTPTDKVTQIRNRLRSKLGEQYDKQPPRPKKAPRPSKSPAPADGSVPVVADSELPAGSGDRGGDIRPDHSPDHHVPTAAEWSKLRPRVIREERYCRTCLDGKGIQPGSAYRAEASQVAKIDPHRHWDRTNLMAVCEPCAQQHGFVDKNLQAHLPMDMRATLPVAPLATDPGGPVLIDDPRQILAAKAELVPDEKVAGHSLLVNDDRHHPPGQRATKLERRVEALRLRQAGCDYRTIRAELVGMGFTVSLKQVYCDVQEALTELAKQEHVAAEEILELELSRLDMMWMAVWPDCEKGDVFALQTALRIMERRAKYLGLDKDRGPDPGSRPYEGTPEEVLRERALQLLSRLTGTPNNNPPVIDITPTAPDESVQ